MIKGNEGGKRLKSRNEENDKQPEAEGTNKRLKRKNKSRKQMGRLDRQTHGLTGIHTDKQTDRQTDIRRQADMHTDRKVVTQTGAQTGLGLV